MFNYLQKKLRSSNCAAVLIFFHLKMKGSQDLELTTRLIMKHNLKKANECQDREHRPTEEG